MALESESLTSAGSDSSLDSRGCDERVRVRSSGERSDRCRVSNTAEVVAAGDGVS